MQEIGRTRELIKAAGKNVEISFAKINCFAFFSRETLVCNVPRFFCKDFKGGVGQQIPVASVKEAEKKIENAINQHDKVRAR